MDSKTWTIPGERMKMRDPFRIPLSEGALKVLETVIPLRDESDLIFPSPMTGKPMSPDSLMKILRLEGVADKQSVHGFRTALRTYGADCTEHPNEVLERAIAHKVGDKTEQAYARSDLYDKRIPLMREWSEYINKGK